MSLKNLNPKLILIIILTLGAFLRFYKLDWGEGLFAHPDEYHIVIAVNKLNFPSQMNPHFFNYGPIVIYPIYFTKLLITNANPFLIGRFYSALYSTLTILAIYYISKFVLKEKYALISTFLVAVTAGLIQQAHFATPESTLIFFITASLAMLLSFVNSSKLSYLILSSIFLGLGLGTKIIASLFLPVLISGLLLKLWRSPAKLMLFLSISLLTIAVTFIVTSPFVFSNYQEWWRSINYEGSLARGTTLVFYTRTFIGTLPVIFQMEKILPLALGFSLLLFSISGFALVIFQLLKKFNLSLFLILFTFLSFFIANSLLYAKWTRFIAPTFPFFAIFAAFLVEQISHHSKKVSLTLNFLLLVPTAIWSLAFFSIYINHDVRIAADNWIKSNLPPQSFYLVESANTIDVPLSFPKKSIDFFNLENEAQARDEIAQTLVKSDYFVIQSRRIFLNHQRLRGLYPKTARFYDALFNGQLGFEQIKEFHSYPSIPFPGSKIEFPDELAEETWSVFDHPVIRVFQKRVSLEKEDYEKILNN